MPKTEFLIPAVHRVLLQGSLCQCTTPLNCLGQKLGITPDSSLPLMSHISSNNKFCGLSLKRCLQDPTIVSRSTIATAIAGPSHHLPTWNTKQPTNFQLPFSLSLISILCTTLRVVVYNVQRNSNLFRLSRGLPSLLDYDPKCSRDCTAPGGPPARKPTSPISFPTTLCLAQPL